MDHLVDRWGRTGFALATSLVWALPMAAWAGSVDLVPGPGPWVAFGIGLVLLVAWLVMLSRVAQVAVSPRRHRYDVAAMSAGERRWNLALVAFGIGLIGWLNAAATVDWRILALAVQQGRVAPALFAVALAVFLVVMLVGVTVSWRRADSAFRERNRG